MPTGPTWAETARSGWASRPTGISDAVTQNLSNPARPTGDICKTRPGW